jgi:hypothetical protein
LPSGSGASGSSLGGHASGASKLRGHEASGGFRVRSCLCSPRPHHALRASGSGLAFAHHALGVRSCLCSPHALGVRSCLCSPRLRGQVLPLLPTPTPPAFALRNQVFRLRGQVLPLLPGFGVRLRGFSAVGVRSCLCSPHHHRQRLPLETKPSDASAVGVRSCLCAPHQHRQHSGLRGQVLPLLTVPTASGSHRLRGQVLPLLTGFGVTKGFVGLSRPPE